jgi:hypothetical protein
MAGMSDRPRIFGVPIEYLSREEWEARYGPAPQFTFGHAIGCACKECEWRRLFEEARRPTPIDLPGSV